MICDARSLIRWSSGCSSPQSCRYFSSPGTTYSILPEPARKPILIPASSTIYRWNEIASALGHTGTQVALQQPANEYFLSDVERLVERALARNMKDRKSET